MMRDVRAAINRGAVDHLHVNVSHHVPIHLATALTVPLTMTLHCPPDPDIAQALRAWPRRHCVVAVSRSVAASCLRMTGWAPTVIDNGVDLAAWPVGRGDGSYVVWSGRLVPEKAPHLAMDIAAAAGVAIKLAGPVHDVTYFDREVRPRLTTSATYVGHLARAELAALVGAARASLVTPVWDEPFGLVATESMACGTPVMAFARGGLLDVIDPATGVLTREDPASCLDALQRTVALDRSAVRARAEVRFDLGRMVQRYLDLFAAADPPVDRFLELAR